MNSKEAHIAKLPKAPLQEVIFELFWNMSYNDAGVPSDSGFDIAQGRFAELIEKDYPYRKRTLPESLPFQIYPKPIHQFWKGENSWPVIQIGPGILAVNDTDKNYHWDNSFFPLIKYSTDRLLSAYRNDIAFNKISLRYIDAVEISDVNPLDFINDNFNVNIKSSFDINGSLAATNLTQIYKTDDDSKLSVVISNGTKSNGAPALIWQSQIQKEISLSIEDVFSWTDKSHKLLSDLFKKVITKDFYERFT